MLQFKSGCPPPSREKQHQLLYIRGSNSVVECNLAKVDVAGSNPVSRSKIFGIPCGNNSVVECSASQAGGRGFKSRFPLHFFSEPAEFSAGSFFCLPLFPRHVWETVRVHASAASGAAHGTGSACSGTQRIRRRQERIAPRIAGKLPAARYAPVRSVPAVFSLMGPRSAGPGNVCALETKKPAAGEQPASERQRRRDVLPYIFF